MTRRDTVAPQKLSSSHQVALVPSGTVSPRPSAWLGMKRWAWRELALLPLEDLQHRSLQHLQLKMRSWREEGRRDYGDRSPAHTHSSHAQTGTPHICNLLLGLLPPGPGSS